MSTFLSQRHAHQIFKHNRIVFQCSFVSLQWMGTKAKVQANHKQFFFMCVISISLGFISPFIVSKVPLLHQWLCYSTKPQYDSWKKKKKTKRKTESYLKSLWSAELSQPSCLNQTQQWYLKTPVLQCEIERPSLLPSSSPPPSLPSQPSHSHPSRLPPIDPANCV